MSDNKHVSLKLNIMYQFFYQVLTIIVPLLTAPYISRILGVDGVGEYSYTFSIAHYFVLFSMLGVLNYGNREIARVKDNFYDLCITFWGIYSVQLLSGILVIIFYFIYIIIFCNHYKVVFFCQCLYVFTGILDISWFYFGIEHFKLTTSISAVNKIITTILVFTLVKNANHVYIYTLIIATGALCNNIFYWLILKKYVSFEYFSFKNYKRHIKPILILFIPVIAVSIYKYMDKVMLGTMLSTFEVGIYESAEKFINLPMCVIAALGTVMLPRITNMKTNVNGNEIKKYNFISMFLVMFLSIGMVFGMAGITDIFIPWFYGADFIKSTNVLFVLLPSIIFVSWANVIRTQCLLPNKRDLGYCVSVISGAVINMIINFAFIPKFGAIGAALGTLIAEILVCIVQSIMCRKDMDFLLYFKYSFPFLISAVLMFLIISNVQLISIAITIITRILIGGIIYLLMSFWFIKKGYTKFKEWR